MDDPKERLDLSEEEPPELDEISDNSEEHSGDSEDASNEESERSNSVDTQMRVKRIGLAAFILSMGILCSRLLGFLREAVIAFQAGAGPETDAYNAAFLLPDLMNHFLAGGTLSITFIPLFAGYIAKKDPKKAERLFSIIATTMGTLVVLAIILCGIFTTPLAHLIFPGFDEGQITRTVEMTRIILPGQFFHYLGALMMAVLMAKGHFVPSAIAPLIYNICIIGFGLALGDSIGMKGFAIGALTGAFLGPFLLPLIFLRKKIQYKPIFGFTDKDFKKYILLTLPLMVGVSLTTVDDWLGKSIGSTIGEGAISWLNYARKLVLVPIGIIGQAAGQAALPYLSQLSARKEYDKVADTLHRMLKNVVYLSMIVIGFFIVLADPMISLIYEHGAFTAQDTLQTAKVLRILCISIVFWTIQMVSVRAFYADQNTLRPMVLTTLVTMISLPIYIVMSHLFGLEGFALSSCIGMALQATCMVIFYHRRNAYFKPLNVVRSICIGLLLGAVTAAGSYGGVMLFNRLSLDLSHLWQILFELAISGSIGLIVVGILSRFIIPNEFRGFTSKLRKKILRR
ncbi:MAG: murein biosynthesis integral membrane protein MurJ [Proteobacteria bacterium]|nr:murein biosynthesis integral membrane protein MurJ [Pseudomonadota bacterium]